MVYGDVSKIFTHKVVAWKFYLQNIGVSESFTHKMAAYKMAALQNKHNVNKNKVEYILRLHLVNVTCRHVQHSIMLNDT